MAVKQGLLYTKDHEWVKVEGETATVSVCRGVVDVKTALTLRFALIVTVVGLAVPAASPAQRVNR